jgi:hypothetical protein
MEKEIKGAKGNRLREKVFRLFNKQSGGKNDLLSLVNEIEKKYNISKRSFREIIVELYIPSPQNFLILVLIFTMLFFLSSSFSFGQIPKESNTYQNLVTILAGISAIIFALVIFIAESSHESEESDKMRVLLKQGFLFPLVTVVILTFIILLSGYANSSTIVLIMFIGFFTIFSISNIIRTLLIKNLFFQKRTELLKERFKQSIGWEIDKRLGDNILLSKLEKEIMLVFNPLAKGENKYYIFRSQKSGIIININLEKLKQFGELLEEEAYRNGKTFYKDVVVISSNTLIKGSGNLKSEIKEPPNKTPLEENKNRYLLKGFRETVDKVHNELICIDKELIKDQKNQNTLHKLENLVKDCFTVEKSYDFSKEIRMEIEGLRDQFIKAIRNGLELNDLEKIYISLAEGFLETISKLGGYSLNQAREERYSLFGGFKEIQWLSSDIKDFFQEAAKAEDSKIISDVFYLPIAIALRAIDFKEQYIFQEFIEFNDYLYFYAFKMQDKNKDLKRFMVDRAWRHLSELGNFYITSRLTDSSSNKQDLETYKDFAIYLFYPFQKLLKKSFDNKDFESFKQFYDATLNLFSTFYPNGPISKNISKEINAKRKQMLFGVASWIFDKFSQNKSDLQLKMFYDTVRNAFSEDIEEFTEVFINCSIDYWGWDSWEIGETKEGEVHFVHFPDKLNKFFVVNALSILSSKTDEEIIGIELPYDRDFASLIGDKNSDLNKVLTDINSNPDNWNFVLSDEAIGKIHSFRELLERVKVTQEEKDSEEKRQKTISEKKVEEFKEEIVKGFYEQATLRQIFKYYNLYQDKTKEISGDEKHKYGFFSILDDKAAFFEEWYVHYLDWGKGYGRNLASSENSFLLDEIIKSCTKISESAFEDKLESFENPGNVIIITTNMSQSWRFFENTKKFIPEWYKNSQDYKDLPTINLAGWEGWYKLEEKLIPIFGIFHGKANGSILILDKSKLGNLVQFSPLSEKDDQRSLKDIFFIDVKPLSERGDLIEKLINEQPEWLVKKYKEREQQVQYLQELAVINIYESFEYPKTEDFKGYIFAPK